MGQSAGLDTTRETTLSPDMVRIIIETELYFDTSQIRCLLKYTEMKVKV